jgi:hypothetical protein
MASVWPEVKQVFEALSYVVKGMSPDGTEMFYTVSYDTYLRRDPSDLCKHLATKPTGGETDISYRLNLQLQGYQAKMYNPKGGKTKKGGVRPLTIYVLTNGEWGRGPDPKITLKETADVLISKNLTGRQVAVEFITFSESEKTSQKLNDLAEAVFGL